MQDGKNLPNLQKEMARKHTCKTREKVHLPVLYGKNVSMEDFKMRRNPIQTLLLSIFIVALVVLSYQCRQLTEELSLMQAEINCLEHNLLQLSTDQLRLTEAFATWLESWQIDMFESSAYSPLDDRNGLNS